MNSMQEIDLTIPFEPTLNDSTIHNLQFSSDQSFKLLYLNARSLNNPNKIDEIEHIVHSTKTTIHVIAITEIWLNDESAKFINIKNYTPIFCCRPTNRAGGVAIFVINQLTNFEIIEKYSNDSDSFLNIKITLKKCFINVICIYRQPNNRLDHIAAFLDKLENCLANTSRNTIVVGDFNFNLNLKNDSTIEEYISLINSNNFFICNKTIITRTASNTIIDHVLTNNIDQQMVLNFLENDYFDHKLILI